MKSSRIGKRWKSSCAILGENITFEEFAIMLRNPTANLNEVKGWHRDLIREFDRRNEIDAISIMFYLMDVSATDHCFAIVPESHNRLLDLNPKEVRPDAGIDLIGPAGTAVIFHARAIHKCAPEAKQFATQNVTSLLFESWISVPMNGTQIPPRLYQSNSRKSDCHLTHWKWNVTETAGMGLQGSLADICQISL